MNNLNYSLLDALRPINRRNSIFNVKYYGAVVATSCYLSGEIYIWDIFTGRPYFIFQNEELIFSMVFSKNGQKLIGGGIFGTITIFDLIDGNIENSFQGHEDCIYCLEYSNENFFISGGMDGIVKFWNESGELLKNYDFYYPICNIAISNDCNKFAFSGWNEKLTVINGTNRYILEEPYGQFLKVNFSPSGEYIATRHYGNIVKVWKFGKLKYEKKFEVNSFGDIQWKKYLLNQEAKLQIYNSLTYKLPDELIEKIIHIVENKSSLSYNNEILFEEK